MRLLYELCCMKNPARTLGLGAGEQIHIVPVSRTVELAKRVVFTGLAQKLQLAPWFKGRFHDTQDYIQFKEKGIILLGGSSSDTSNLGLNVLAAILDELNFHGASKRRSDSAAGFTPSKAQMIYDALVRRVKSRYERSGVKGMVFLVSSKRATTDFTETRIRESINSKTDRTLFVMDYATWHVRPEPFKDQKWYRAALSTSDGRVTILGDKEAEPSGMLVFDFPEDYLSEFERDPIGATRDVAGIATDAVSPFIPDRDAIDDMFTEDMATPFGTHEWRIDQPLVLKWDDVRMQNARGEYIPICCAASPRHVHIDLSKNQCATGFTMIHQAGSTEVKRLDPESGKMVTEEVPVLHVDGILRITAPQGGSIDHAEVRNLVYRFIDAGYFVRSISMDQWMSVPNQQAFERRGLKTEVISTVRTLDPYLSARGAVIERRIKSHPSPPLKKEIIWLELDETGKKIIAPTGGCFTGDTEVRLLDGRSRSFVELVAEFGNGRPFYVYTIRGGLVSVGTARNPRLTKHATELVEVVLDNGRRIRCTPDHRFMMRDGSYLEAEQLQVGDSLMPLYTSVSTRKTRGGLIGYELFMCPSDDRWHFTHRMVGRWKYPDSGYTGNQYGNGIIHHCSVSVVERRVRFAKTGVPRNHKVLSVQRIAQSADVYDLTVDETENFALSSGVFVHNSKDVADSWAGAVYYASKHATSGGGALSIIAGAKASPRQAPVRLAAGGEIRWADEDAEEQAAKDDLDGFGSFIIR